MLMNRGVTIPCGEGGLVSVPIIQRRGVASVPVNPNESSVILTDCTNIKI